MRKKIFSQLLLCLIGVFSLHSAAFAQTKTITGTVLDDKGSILPGATVTTDGEKISTTTNAEGKFSITVPAGARTLVFSYIGMQPQEITIGSKTSFTVSLRTSASVLGDVVVIGYGTQKRGDINGAVSSVSSKQIAEIPQPSVDQMLQGRAAGVTVTQNSGQPGAAVSVRVRGITSFSGSEPLYVIDGVAIDGNANNGHQLTSSASPSEQESSLLNNRIDASVDVYQKTSKDFLFQQPLPAFLAGATAEYSNAAIVQPPWVNAGKIENKGVELSVTSHNIIGKDFIWTTNVIFSHFSNKVISLNGFPAIIGNVATGFGPPIPATYTQVGGPVGEFYGYKTKGIISTAAQLADLAVHPQNVIGSPEIVSSDRTLSNAVYYGDILYAGNDGKGGANKQYALGDPNPTFTYSFTNNFSYKDFELSVFFTGSYGGKILNAVSYQTQGLYQLYQNQLASTASFWTPSNLLYRYFYWLTQDGLCHGLA